MSMSCKSIAKEMIRDRITPGVVLLASYRDEIFYCETIGTTQYQDQGTQLVARDTIYDIASITKIITATSILMLLDRDDISLNDPIARFFPMSTYGKEVTIRHLLTHTSGIAIQMSKIAELKDQKLMHQVILQASLGSKPGDIVMFTNANSYLLGKIIEHVSGQSLDQFFHHELFMPLAMKNTTFNPPQYLRRKIAPTEIIEERGCICGEVHDESAFALGGVVGHAGLFSTADDLSRFCQLWLQEGEYNGRRFFSKALAQEAVKNQAPAGTLSTGFGWMLNKEWMGQLGPLSFGHTAFTGPSIMITPDYCLTVVLLTNRTYPHRTDVNRHLYQAKIMNVLSSELIKLSNNQKGGE